MSRYLLDELVRHVEPPLQRRQIRSPIHVLSNVLRQLRQMRALRCVSPGCDLRSFAMLSIWALMPGGEGRWIQGSHAPCPTVRGQIRPVHGNPSKRQLNRELRRALCLLTRRARPLTARGNLSKPAPLIVSVEAIPGVLPGLTTGASRMTLQDMIDAAFGAQEMAPPPQAPSEAFKERDRAFAERAQKIESLRLARLTNAGEPAPAPLLFEIVRARGYWRTRHANKDSAAFPDQASAIAAARKLAIAKRKEGHAVKVVLQRTDGKEVIQPVDDEPDQSGGE